MLSVYLGYMALAANFVKVFVFIDSDTAVFDYGPAVWKIVGSTPITDWAVFIKI